uniref:Uncharacterized protein n=1 Tax=Rangifer tarandus platyrhynchus TaxID=3082113 RepID=A0ACB0E7U1_RANTA|nr:unnamed protein product [Rangifer tarandus platyrhynchus]
MTKGQEWEAKSPREDSSLGTVTEGTEAPEDDREREDPSRAGSTAPVVSLRRSTPRSASSRACHPGGHLSKGATPRPGDRPAAGPSWRPDLRGVSLLRLPWTSVCLSGKGASAGPSESCARLHRGPASGRLRPAAPPRTRSPLHRARPFDLPAAARRPTLAGSEPAPLMDEPDQPRTLPTRA